MISNNQYAAKSNGKQKYMQLICVVVLLVVACQQQPASCQGLPEDMQRELNANLAEQARIQAQRARHQQAIQARTGNVKLGQSAAAAAAAANPGKQSATPTQPPHDPNNYSYQQVSPPVQYSYYQPYGDLAQQQQPQQQQQQQQQQQRQQQPIKPINIDLNNLNFDIPASLPTPQAQTAAQRRHHQAPSFTGAGGLPVLAPVAAAQQSPDTFAPMGQAPMAPQARQGPPLSEADFKDITGGENYGAPGGSDFGMGGANSAGGGGGEAGAGAGDGTGEGASEPRNDAADTDAQLREFGMPEGAGQGGSGGGSGNQQAVEQNPMQQMGLGDFGMGGGGGGGGGGANNGGGRRSGGFDPFGGGGFDFGNMGGSAQPTRQPAARSNDGTDFDFASQPSSQSQGRGDAAHSTLNGAAPGSLQSLLGNAFPGLGGGNGGNMGLDGLARGQPGQPGQQQQQQQRAADDGALDIADMGDRSDGFGGADLGGFEQPSPQGDQDYNYAAAAEQQPVSVPYPDGGPQFVGSLWALSQPQSLSQARYNALPDKGTYQDYPAYQANGGNDFAAVRQVVDQTPRARATGPGRYGHPEPNQAMPEYRSGGGGDNQPLDYSQPPMSAQNGNGNENTSEQQDEASSLNVDDFLE